VGWPPGGDGDWESSRKRAVPHGKGYCFFTLVKATVDLQYNLGSCWLYVVTISYLTNVTTNLCNS
jgi:hypothetical protein